MNLPAAGRRMDSLTFPAFVTSLACALSLAAADYFRKSVPQTVPTERRGDASTVVVGPQHGWPEHSLMSVLCRSTEDQSRALAVLLRR